MVDDPPITSFEDLLADRPPLWQPQAQRSVERSLSAGVPSEALAVFARWWQLESWLRFLVYLELRAARGKAWDRGLPDRALQFWGLEDENAYMPTADASNALAYLDARELFELIAKPDVWAVVRRALPAKKRWEGVAETLRVIRNRNAHLRRPHPDDLDRLEQVLRDLELGARLSLEAFNRRRQLRDRDDPLHAAWIQERHEAASRLVGHVERNYDIAFSLEESWRPWSDAEPRGRGRGRLIHASWYLRDGAGLEPTAFWTDSSLDSSGVRDLLVVVTHDSDAQVTVTFSGVDSTTAVADAIGICFELVVRHRVRAPSPAWRRAWLLRSGGLDWRVHVADSLTLATEDQPFSVFQA
jgi:hypothetical protein